MQKYLVMQRRDDGTPIYLTAWGFFFCQDISQAFKFKTKLGADEATTVLLRSYPEISLSVIRVAVGAGVLPQ
jgi:hypothetical protein